MSIKVTGISFYADTDEINDRLSQKYTGQVYEDMTESQVKEIIADEEAVEINSFTCEEGDFSLENASLILDGARGIYIPQNFCEAWQQNNISDDDWQCCLRGPHCVESVLTCWNTVETQTIYSDCYWEAWQQILDNWEAVADGVKYTLHQDGDLWMIEENSQRKTSDNHNKALQQKLFC